MHIIVVGAGNVGYTIARMLSKQHAVMVIEDDIKRYDYIVNHLNVGAINANGASPKVLKGLDKRGDRPDPRRHRKGRDEHFHLHDGQTDQPQDRYRGQSA